MMFSLKQSIFIGCCIFVFGSAFLPQTVSAGVLTRQPNNLGLIGYWSFNEGQGTTVGDFSGNGNTGTLTNGPTWTNGKLGKGLQFDGVDDGFNVNGIAGFAPTAFTVNWWLNPESCNFNQGLQESNSWGAFVFHTDNTCSAYVGTDADNNHRFTPSDIPSNTIELNQWQMLTFIYDGSQGRFYKNGQLIAGPKTMNQPVTWTSFGVLDSAVHGKLDEVRIYNRALSGTEVATMYNSGAITFKQPSKNGLVGHWNFDEGRGTSAGDVSGNNNTGTLTNGPTWANGKVGGAVNFDGSNDYIALTNNAQVSSGEAITISAWVKSNTSGVWQGIVGSQGSASGFHYQINPSNYLQLYVYANSAGGDAVGSIDLSQYINQWVLLTATYDGSTVKVYVNGVLDASGSASGSIISASDMRIGQVYDNVRYMSGLIDDVRIYSYALSDTEIAKLYTTGQYTAQTVLNAPQNTQLTDGLVGFWSFNGKDVAGTTAYDRSGNGNDGTLTNGPTPTIGKVGQALKFDGVDDYVDLSSVGSGASVLTISAWVNKTATDRTYILVKTNTGVNTGTGLEIYPDTLYFNVDAGWRQASYTIDNEWTHVVMVFDTGTITTYVNGQLIVTSPGDTIPSTVGTFTANWQVGRRPWVEHYSKSSVDEVRIYNRALSAYTHNYS